MTLHRLDGPRLPPAKGAAQQLVVLLHGYGADGDDLIELASHWHRVLPHAAFVAPHAPARIPGQPPGQPGGRQWFGLANFDPNQLRRDPAQAAGLHEKMLAGAESAAPSLNAFLDDELARHRLPPRRLALVGFSQGTMMALHVGLRRPGGVGAILGFSGTLVGASALAELPRSAAPPPVLLIHGSADDLVPLEAMFSTLNGLVAAEIPARWHICMGLPHSIDAAGMELGGRFLAGCM